MRIVQIGELADDVAGVPERVVVAEVPEPVPGPGQVRIGIRAAGCNFPDLLMAAGQYQFQAPLPFTPGAEFAGVIDMVGPGVAGWERGMHVVATALTGGFGEKAVVDATACFSIPEQLDFADAAVLPLAFGTALHALRDRAHLAAGETLLVTGATGGTGSAAMKLGRIMGAKVIAAVGSSAKTDLALSIGADDVVVYDGATRLRDQIRTVTAQEGVDVVFDAVGGDVFSECVRTMAWGGRLLVVGFTSGQIPRIATNLPLLKGMSVVGVFWGRWREIDPTGSAAQLTELAQMVVDGTLDTGITARYPLEETARALAAIANRTVAGKVVITP